MIIVLAIIMSVMILILGIICCGLLVLVHDNVKERDFIDSQRVRLDEKLAAFEAPKPEDRIDDVQMLDNYNDIVNRHFPS